MKKTQKKILTETCYDTVGKERVYIKSTFVSIFSLNTDSFEK